ncbi:MAG: VOC family protein, partial [Halodesulfurarchaeum sp.]
MTSPSISNPLPEGTHIGRSALRVSDRGAVADFYRTVVGLASLTDTETTSILGVDETPLLVLEDDGDARPRQRTQAGLYHNAFRVPSRGALGDALARIREHWELDGASDHRVSEALYLSDPEGNGVEIYRDYPPDE